MNEFQKSQSLKILASYSDENELIKGGALPGTISKDGLRKKEGDGHWSWIHKNNTHKQATSKHDLSKTWYDNHVKSNGYKGSNGTRKGIKFTDDKGQVHTARMASDHKGQISSKYVPNKKVQEVTAHHDANELFENFKNGNYKLHGDIDHDNLPEGHEDYLLNSGQLLTGLQKYKIPLESFSTEDEAKNFNQFVKIMVKDKENAPLDADPATNSSVSRSKIHGKWQDTTKKSPSLNEKERNHDAPYSSTHLTDSGNIKITSGIKEFMKDHEKEFVDYITHSDQVELNSNIYSLIVGSLDKKEASKDILNEMSKKSDYPLQHVDDEVKTNVQKLLENAGKSFDPIKRKKIENKYGILETLGDEKRIDNKEKKENTPAPIEGKDINATNIEKYLNDSKRYVPYSALKKYRSSFDLTKYKNRKELEGVNPKVLSTEPVNMKKMGNDNYVYYGDYVQLKSYAKKGNDWEESKHDYRYLGTYENAQGEKGYKFKGDDGQIEHKLDKYFNTDRYFSKILDKPNDLFK